MCRIALVLDNLDRLSLVARFQVEQSPTIEYEPFQVQLRKSYFVFSISSTEYLTTIIKKQRFTTRRVRIVAWRRITRFESKGYQADE